MYDTLTGIWWLWYGISMSRGKEFHYTKDSMVKRLVGLLEGWGLVPGCSILDAGSGLNKVWYGNLPANYRKYECEVDDGCNFYKWDREVDWVVGNPPFHEGWKFVDKATDVANCGVAFLGNINFWNCLTPNRLERVREKGFRIERIHVVMDKRWFGRYYFIVFRMGGGEFISWDKAPY